jgi:CHAD domain-containing protein
MAFRLLPDEPPQEGLPRCAAEEYDKAIAHLAGPAEERQTAVHEARKCLKRIRALLRLVRPALGKRYKRENAQLREIAALLSPYRDADAMLELLASLRQSRPEMLDQRMYAQAHAALQGRRDGLVHADQGYPPVARMAIERLRAARQGLETWQLPANPKSLEAALRDSYRRARKAGKRAAASNEVEDYHDWRKRVKALLYQSELFRDTRLGPPARYRKQLDGLAELLGEHHDLSVFEELLATPAIFPDRAHAEQVLTLVGHRRQELEQQAGEIWKALFCTKPGHYFGGEE